MQGNSKLLVYVALMITIVIDVMGMGLVFPMLPALITSPHATLMPLHSTQLYRDFMYGVLMAIWPLGLFFGAPFFGDLSDKVGRKQIIVVCLAGTALTYALAAIAIDMHSLWMFLLVRLISGFFAGSFEIAQAVIVDISKPEEKQRNMGWITFAASLGIIFGPLVSGLTSNAMLLSWFTVATPFWVAAVMSVINIGSIICLLRESFPVQKDLKVSIFKAFASFKFIFVDPRTRWLACVFFLIMFGWGYFIQVIILWLQKDFHYDASWLGYFMAFTGLGCVISMLVLQPIAVKRWSVKGIYWTTTLFTAIFMAIVLIWPQIWVIWIGGMCAVMFELLAFNTSLAQFSNLVDEHEQGKVLGGTGAVFGIAWLVEGLTVGPLASHSIYLPMWLGTACFFLAVVGILAYRARTAA